MRKKYELTEELKILADGAVLRRIRAVRDFILANGANVHAGDLGGWIECEENLSHDGSAWVYDNAAVSDNARIFGGARVFGNAMVSGAALIGNDARIRDDVLVGGEARVGGCAEVFGNADVFAKAWVCGNANVCGNARIFGNAVVGGEAIVSGEAQIFGNAEVCDINDYSLFKNTWSSGQWFTYTRSDKMWAVGCFRGTGEELIAKAYGDSMLSGQCYMAIVRAQEAIDKAIEKAQRAK